MNAAARFVTALRAFDFSPHGGRHFRDAMNPGLHALTFCLVTKTGLGARHRQAIGACVTALGIQGAISSPSGLTLATFSHFFPAAAIEWIINPGQVAYNVIASKRRLEASEQQDQAVALETTRVAAVQYYDLVLTQTRVSVAWRAIKEAQDCSA